MKILRSIHTPLTDKKVALTIGNFDGIHLGHQAIFKKMAEEKGRTNGQTVVLTFEPHPVKFLSPGKEPLLLTPFHEKMELLEKFNIDIAVCVPFTEEKIFTSQEELRMQVKKDIEDVKKLFYR